MASPLVLAIVLSTLPVTIAPRVKVFGASWCGPCRAVKEFLHNAAVPFDYFDVDDSANLEKMREVSVAGGIPVTVIDGEVIVGANLGSLRATLTRRGIKMPTPPTAGEPVFGELPASYWQAQFQDLRERVTTLRAKVQALDKVAVDDVERGVTLPKLRHQLVVLEAALNQLELDASREGVPRRYRAY